MYIFAFMCPSAWPWGSPTGGWRSRFGPCSSPPPLVQQRLGRTWTFSNTQEPYGLSSQLVLSSQPHLHELIPMGRRALPGPSRGRSRAHSLAVRAASAPLRGTIRRASDTSDGMVSAGMLPPCRSRGLRIRGQESGFADRGPQS
jgi:hypothetical protein